MKTSTQRSREFATRNPESAAMRKRKQRAMETDFRAILFWAKFHVHDLTQMPDFPNARPEDVERAIAEAKAAHGVDFWKMSQRKEA